MPNPLIQSQFETLWQISQIFDTVLGQFSFNAVGDTVYDPIYANRQGRRISCLRVILQMSAGFIVGAPLVGARLE